MDYSVAGLCVQKESENTSIIHVIIAPKNEQEQPDCQLDTRWV